MQEQAVHVLVDADMVQGGVKLEAGKEAWEEDREAAGTAAETMDKS